MILCFDWSLYVHQYIVSVGLNHIHSSRVTIHSDNHTQFYSTSNEIYPDDKENSTCGNINNRQFVEEVIRSSKKTHNMAQ